MLKPEFAGSPQSVKALSEDTACRSRGGTMSQKFLEILDFTLFFDYFVFVQNEENVLEKQQKREIPVSVGIELVVVDI